MPTNNKKLGSSFEQEICNFLATNGWWARLMYPAPDGSQPFDIEAKKGNVSLLLECKTISNKNNMFPLDRVEDNQISAYEGLSSLNIPNQYFVFKRIDGTFWVTPSEKIITSVYNGHKQVIAGEKPLKDVLNANTLQ
ncbi:MAG: hypothetical protein RBR02_06430 [Desulfuromonadaceae bacterium]|nr:hypothetical protein [Desulfuromonadaceae bacterium]